MPLSRARLRALIEQGHAGIEAAGAPVEGAAAPGSAPGGRGARPRAAAVRPASRLRAGDRVWVEVPPPVASRLAPEPIPLAVVYEDAHLLVVDKPPGLTVHPGAGRRTGTLVHAVLARCPDLPGIGGEDRPGIVHRLDKDTSGLLVVAKSETALRELQAQIQTRRMRREYLALVHGRVAQDAGTIDAPIGRDPLRRTRMAIVPGGRGAVTHYQVLERFADATLLRLRLETGRTHQIRVHCASLGHPVAGDATYGRRTNPWGLRRQALHAARLLFDHPVTGAPLVFEAPLPEDMARALAQLRSRETGAAARAGRPEDQAVGRAPRQPA